MIFLAAICLALVALLAFREWGAARERRATSRTIVSERLAAAQERRELYQRIQAPDLAIAEHVRESRPPRRKPKPIAADDDAAFMERDGVKRDG